MIPWFAVAAALLFLIGLYMSFFVAPTDYQQHDAYRIIFIHVPAAWMGMSYMCCWPCTGGRLAFNARLASMMATAIAPTGAIFTFISLVTDRSGPPGLGSLVGLGCAADFDLL